jgi:uncharacterized membrane protein YidH (DUF202 family)
MNKKLLEYGVYGLLGVIMIVFAIYGLGIGFAAEFATSLEREIVRSFSLADFDLFLISQIGLIVTGAALIGLLVYLDEKSFRKMRKN